MDRVRWGVLPDGKNLKRWVLFLLCFLPVMLASCFDSRALPPTVGLFEYRSPGWLDVAGGRVDVMGGNLVVQRMAFSIDTLLGTREVGAVYNSGNGSWMWSFQVHYDGETFVDETGATHDVRAVPDGASIPGTHWRKLDGQRIASKGGLVHHFEPETHRLGRIYWGEHQYPALVFHAESIAGEPRTVSVDQCLEDECFHVYRVEYDAQGCVSFLEDRAGRQAEVLNDGQCRPLVSRDPLDRVNEWTGRSYEYDSGSLVATTSSEGVRSEYVYHDGRLLAVSRPQSVGSITVFTYGLDLIGGLYSTRVIEPDGGVRQYSYDEEGRLHDFEDGLGSSLEIVWSGFRPVQLTDRAGEVTTWEYSDDDPVRVIRPDGNRVETEYRPGACNREFPFATPRTFVSDSVGQVEYNVYGQDCWLATTIESDGSYVVYQHDETGHIVSAMDARNQLTWFLDYGEHGHPERIKKSGVVQRQRFDQVGNLLAGGAMEGPVDPGRPGVVTRSFDVNRNLKGLELEGGTEGDPFLQERLMLEVEYRSDGRPSRIMRPFGGDTRFDYDAAGNQVGRSERVDGEWQPTRYEYSAMGRLTAKEWPNGIRHEVDYDVTGKVVARRFMRGGEVEKMLQDTWSSGRLVSRRDSERPGEERIHYDEVGRVVAIHFPEGEVLESRRDLRGREVERVYRMGDGAPPLRTLAWVYDEEDRMVELWDQEELLLENHYEWGRLQKVVYGNGLDTEFSYNERSGLVEEAFTASSVDSDPSLVHVSTLREWTPCGHSLSYCVTSSTVAQMSDDFSVPLVDAMESYQVGPLMLEDFALDLPGSRLRGWSEEDVAEGAYPGVFEYGFDALGNWIGVWERGEEVARFSYNAERNRLLSANLPESHVYTWDEAGFMQSRDGEPIEWDAAGRPSSLGGGHEIRWDSLGRPLSYRRGDQVSLPLFGGRVSGDSARQPIRIDLVSVEIDLSTGDHLYRQFDHRGNVHFVMGDEGEILNLYSYSPFGVAAEWGEGGNGRTFAQGQELGGYIWLQDRLYDPEVGRFLSPDPVYQLVNQFSYTLGNPVFFWDPLGRQSTPNPLVRLANKVIKFAERLQAIGYNALTAALNTGSYSSAVTALVAVVGGITLKWAMEQFCSDCVRIEDPPFSTEGGELEGGDGTDSSGDVTSCSPQVLRAEPDRMHQGWFWFPLQFLLAFVLLRIGRGNGGR